MSKIIDQVRVRCKTFVRGCEISRKTARTNGLKVGLAKRQAEGKTRGKVTTFSRESRRRLRECLASARPRLNCDYHVLGMCFTIPNELGDLDHATADKYADIFREMFHAWAVAFVKHFKEVGLVWRVELQESRMPHVHLVAYIPLGFLDEFTTPDGETFNNERVVYEQFLAGPRQSLRRNNAKPIKLKWKNAVPSFCFIARRLWLKQLQSHDLFTPAASIYSLNCLLMKSDNAVHYLCDHHTKGKQAQLGWQGRQWGIINRPALVFEESAPIELDRHQSGKFAWIMARIEANRIAARTKPAMPAWKVRRLVRSLRLRYCVDSVRSSLKPETLANLRIGPGRLGNALDAPTFDTLRNYSRIEYRPIGMPILSSADAFECLPFPSLVRNDRPGEMTVAELFERVRSGFFESCDDALLAPHEALRVRLARPLVQGVLSFSPGNA